MTDYKQLCGKLADELGKYHARVIEDDGYGSHDTEALLRLADKALAEPEPEGPTDEEIMELMPQQMRDDLAAAARALACFDPDHVIEASVFRVILNRHAVDHVQAALARWGNNTSRSNFDD